MKILKIREMEKKAFVVVDEFPNSTFVIDLKNISSQAQVLSEVKDKYNNKKEQSKSKFKELKLHELEGVEINA